MKKRSMIYLANKTNNKLKKAKLVAGLTGKGIITDNSRDVHSYSVNDIVAFAVWDDGIWASCKRKSDGTTQIVPVADILLTK